MINIPFFFSIFFHFSASYHYSESPSSITDSKALP